MVFRPRDESGESKNSVRFQSSQYPLTAQISFGNRHSPQDVTNTSPLPSSQTSSKESSAPSFTRCHGLAPWSLTLTATRRFRHYIPHLGPRRQRSRIHLPCSIVSPM